MLDGRDGRLEILQVRWKGCTIRNTHIEGSSENWKYTMLFGVDGRLKILKVRWQGCKIGNTQGQVEGMRDQKYSRLVEGLKD